MKQWLDELNQLYQAKVDHVLVTLVAVRGSAPQEVGAKMIVTRQGRQSGTVGGGKIEAHCIRHSQSLLESGGESELQTWNLQSDIQMSCGGEATLFFETVLFSKWPITIFGAGHVAQELCRSLSRLSCRVLVIDSRPEWLDKIEHSANLEKICSEELQSQVVDLPKNSVILCMTQGHATDLPILFAALNRAQPFSFVGVIGSEVKAKKIKKQLLELGLPEEKLAQLVSPLGLPIGNNTPAEIAVSITAQLLMERDRIQQQESRHHD